MIAIAVLGLAEQILRVIENHQKLMLASEPEVRDRFMARLDKWETFWETLVKPINDLVVKEINKPQ